MEKQDELTLYHCDRLKSFAELVKKVEEFFGKDIPFETLDVSFGIVSITFQKKPQK